DRGQEVRDEERADPGARARPVVDVDGERDDGEHRPDARAERGEEQQPEAGRAPEEGERSPHEAEAARACASASAKIAVSSGVPTLTRIPPGEPNPCRGRTITPSRSSASNSGRASSPTSA